MQVTLDINGRKALPLRAIPYVTSWKTSPDEIVGVLAAPKITKIEHGTEIRNKYNELLAYQMDAQGNVVQVPPSQWNQWIVTFDSLTKKLRANEREDAENENYALWRIKAVLELPDNVFVWLDDFQPWYDLTLSQNSSICESEHDDDDGSERVDDTLCMAPILPPKIKSRLWCYSEGFVATEPSGLHEQSATMQQMPQIDQEETNASEPIDPAAIRMNENRAFFLDCFKNEIDKNIESIWLHIRNNAGKENFLFKSVSAGTATTIEGKQVTKKNLGRNLMEFLKTQKTD